MRGISNSQLQSWMDCPFRLYLQYLQQCKPIFWKPENFFVGATVHESAEGYFLNWYSSKASQKYILYYLYEELKSRWKYNEKAIDFAKAYNNLKGIAEFESQRVLQNPYKPHIELTRDVKKAGVYIKVDVFDEQLVKLKDWKTSSSVKVNRGEKIQACVYKLGVDEEFNIDLDEVGFIFPHTEPYTEIKVKFNDPEIIKLMEEVKDAVRQVQKCFITKKFEKKPRTAGYCNYCNLKSYCRGLRV